MASSREIEHVAAAWLARRDAGGWSERDRLQKLSDDRRDSKSVYIGTAFRF